MDRLNKLGAMAIVCLILTDIIFAQSPSPQGGPYFHQIYSASSKDGMKWTKDGVMLIDHASVPCAIVTPQGKIRLYYVDASQAPETVNCAESDDGGKTFKPMGLTISGRSEEKAVDPSIVRLSDGKYRLYYYASKQNPDGPGGHSIYSAISDDGVTFTQEKKVFAMEGLVDPDVFTYKHRWFIYVFSLSEGGTVIGESADGLDFKYHSILQLRNWGTTAPFVLTDGRLRLFAFNQPNGSKICSFLSTDGIHWKQEPGVRLEADPGEQLTDPFVVRLPDGSWKMFYKSDRHTAPQS